MPILQPELRYTAMVEYQKALYRGILVREACSVCGTNVSVLGHHEDYSRPLDVRWLCPKHHGLSHREINAAKVNQ